MDIKPNIYIVQTDLGHEKDMKFDVKLSTIWQWQMRDVHEWSLSHHILLLALKTCVIFIECFLSLN
jgi:hypothetical protein